MEKRNEILFFPESYKENPGFTYEQAFDAKYNSYLHSSFSLSRASYAAAMAEEKYNRSFISYLKTNYLQGNYPKRLSEYISDMSMTVNIVVIRKGKIIKSFEELKLSDNAIDAISYYHTLKKYNKNLIKYKNSRDKGKEEFFIFEYGEQYKSTEEFNTVRQLIDLTQKAIKIMEEENFWELSVRVAMFLKENIDIVKEKFEYGIVLETIYHIPSFDKEDKNFIEKLNSQMASALRKEKDFEI